MGFQNSSEIGMSLLQSYAFIIDFHNLFYLT